MAEGGGVMYPGVVAKNNPAKLSAARRRQLAEDEADYRLSQKSIRSGKPIPLAKVLKELGYRVER